MKKLLLSFVVLFTIFTTVNAQTAKIKVKPKLHLQEVKSAVALDDKAKLKMLADQKKQDLLLKSKQTNPTLQNAKIERATPAN
jgi:uncharacterized membrane protein YvbJ